MLESFLQKRKKSSAPDISKYETSSKGKRKNSVGKEKGTASITNRVTSDLKGSKFRILNELLYTSPSGEAVSFFQDNDEMFQQYHDGFRKQVENWSSNPLDVIIKELDKNPKYHGGVICDLGCGEGGLHEHFINDKVTEPKFKEIRSFDLAKNKPFVEICDITNLPLENEYADICVFSLALMNTNYLDSLLETHRVLKKNGHLIIAEVSSRLPNMLLFVKMVKSLGFKFKKYMKKNTYFIVLIFKKKSDKTKKKTDFVPINLTKDERNALEIPRNIVNINFEQFSKYVLLPCIYKKR